jgi:selenocysteine-specific elongation factor
MVAELPVRTGVRPSDVPALIESVVDAMRRIGDRLYAERAIQELGTRLVALVNAHHTAAPLEPGAPLQSMRARLGTESALIEAVLREQVANGALEVNGALVLRRGWRPTLTAAQGATRSALLEALTAAGREPPSVTELTARFGVDTPALLRDLERAELVVQVEVDRYYAADAVAGMVADLRAGMADGGEYGPAELREILGSSRKYLIPFLEYCDRTGITTRRATGRTL